MIYNPNLDFFVFHKYDKKTGTHKQIKDIKIIKQLLNN